jgi:hypothetical protein
MFPSLPPPMDGSNCATVETGTVKNGIYKNGTVCHKPLMLNSGFKRHHHKDPSRLIDLCSISLADFVETELHKNFKIGYFLKWFKFFGFDLIINSKSWTYYIFVYFNIYLMN